MKQSKEVCEKIEKLLGKDKSENTTKIGVDNIQDLINKGNTQELGEALLTPVKEVFPYESVCGKVCTESEEPLNSIERKIVVPLDLKDPTIEKLTKVQDKGRESILYQEDKALIDLLRQGQTRIGQKTVKGGFDTIRTESHLRKMPCDYIYTPRILVYDIVNECSNMIDPVNQRELVMAGYIGRLAKTEQDIMVITNAGTTTFTLLDTNEMFGIHKAKCKRKVLSDYRCVETAKGYVWEATIQLELLDKDAIVWVALNKNS